MKKVYVFLYLIAIKDKRDAVTETAALLDVPA